LGVLTGNRIEPSHQGIFRQDQGKRPMARVLPGLLRYCGLGVLPVNPARRNASAIASPLAGTELFRPARVSAGRRRFSDPVGAISVRVVLGRGPCASSSRIVNEIRRRFGSTSNTLTRTTSPGFAILRGSFTYALAIAEMCTSRHGGPPHRQRRRMRRRSSRHLREPCRASDPRVFPPPHETSPS
jgi:hypothetical protein